MRKKKKRNVKDDVVLAVMSLAIFLVGAWVMINLAKVEDAANSGHWYVDMQRGFK